MRAKNINDNLFSYKSGKAELIRNVNGNIHQRNHCQGWCRFFKLAREKFGSLVVLKQSDAHLFFLTSSRSENELVPLELGGTYDMNNFTGNDAACAVPLVAAINEFNVKTMLRDVFLNNADNLKGWGIAFSGASARKTLPHATLRQMRLEAEAAEAKAAAEARPFEIEEVEEGCYLMHNDNNRGTMYECWSEDYVEGR
jgi:sarcosine oxidase delta subunit